MSSLIKTAFHYVAKQYQASVAKSIGAYGLQYEDLLIERDDVNKALARIDHSVLVEREQRIKRAFDVSAKKKLLPIENQTKDPLKSYLHQELSMAERDRQERELLNRY